MHGLADDRPDLILVQPVLLLQPVHRPTQLLVGFALCESLFECFACAALDMQFAFQGIVELGLLIRNSVSLLLRCQTEVILD